MTKKSLKSSWFGQVPVVFAVAVSFNPKLVRQVGSCTPVKENTAMVYVLKQWHLPPSVNTKLDPKPLPQAKNQTEIYNQLSEWINAGTLNTVIAEGCEGEIGPKQKEAFQGWTYSDLETRALDKNYSEILAHPVLKLQAKYPKQAQSACGDNLAEIKRSQLALSDARADVGYFGKLSENKDKPQKLKPYLEDVIGLYHLSKEATTTDALKAVATDLKTSLDVFQASTHERDLSFIQKISSLNSAKPTVLVVGGLHAQDLKDSLEKKKMNCVILEPLAYQNDEEALAQKLKLLLK